MDRRNALFTLSILALAAGALAARLPGIEQRPMHCDEANQAVRAGWLLETGRYDYDPWDGHGPTLYWLTLPVLRLSGAADLAETSEWQYRIVPALFGAGLILLLLLVSDGLGRGPAVIAGLLVAISPAMVFYSRYYIQEMLLVFFTFAAIACAWRYIRNPRLGWAIAVGACFGLMHATKETWILAAFAMAAGLALTLAWARWREGGTVPIFADTRAPCLRGRWWAGHRPPVGRGLSPLSQLRPAHLLAAFVAACVVVIALYSSFGTHWRGPLDSITAYTTYFRRGGGGGDHAHAWDYYFQILAAYLPLRGWVWTRWAMIGLAALCWLAAICSRHRAPTTFVRFLVFYTLILTALYCAISYKTPWCLLSFLHGLILLAAVGAWAILRGPGILSQAKVARAIYRTLAGVVLLLAVARLGWECFLLNGKHSASDRNPFVYNHTSVNVLNLATMIERLAQVAPEDREIEIQVVAPEFWPLPWYLRRLDWDRRCQDCWWEDPAEWIRDEAWTRRPAVILFAPQFQEDIEQRLEGRYQGQMSYNLRPKVVLEFYVRDDVWNAYERQ